MQFHIHQSKQEKSSRSCSRLTEIFVFYLRKLSNFAKIKSSDLRKLTEILMGPEFFGFI